MREFSWQRTLRLALQRLPGDLWPLAIGALTLLGIKVVAWLVSGVWGVPFGRENADSAPWPYLVVLACWLTSARAFHDMHSLRSGTEWLLLPASPFEKFLANLLETQVLVPVAASAMGLALWLATGDFGIPKIFGTWQAWGMFVVVNLIFFAGSTVFRKLAFIKTSAAGLAFLVVMLALPLGLALRLHTGKFPTSAGTDDLINVVWHLGVFVLTPVAALLFSFFRVREKEARDAVQ